jgi:hypothetical protein
MCGHCGHCGRNFIMWFRFDTMESALAAQARLEDSIFNVCLWTEDYVTPDGKERHVPENLRNAFDYLLTKYDGSDSSALVHKIKVEDWETNLCYLSGRLYYCTDDLPPDVVELLDRLDINIEKQYAIYGYTYAAAAHALSLAIRQSSGRPA